jgi:hypothetical protein
MIIWISLIISWFYYKYKEKAKIDWKKIKPEFLLIAIFALFVFYGIINGYVSGNYLKNIFLDVNAWLYFILLLPAYDYFSKNYQNNREELAKKFLNIFTLGAIWISVKTLILLYAFSHNFYFLSDLYSWVRDTRVGEITQMQGGFYRIFIQSQIYVLAAFFIYLGIYFAKLNNDEKNLKEFLIISLFFSVCVINFSRSNWVGLLVGGIYFLILLLKKYGAANVKKYFINFAYIVIFSFLMIAVIIKFPLPNPEGGFSATDLLLDRATKISGEAGISSRWALLPPLITEISKSPFFGKGFGSTVTYYSSDPRILENNPQGKFTTFSFEWGWLDIWLKIGMGGMLLYISMIIYLFYKKISYFLSNYSIEADIAMGITVTLLVVTAINIFSPYLNHPLGIGIIIISFIL